MALFFFLQAENLYTPEQYEATLLFVLDKCEVDVAALNQIHALIQATLEDRRLSLKLSRMTVIQGRPRLRDLVSSELKTEERKAQVDTLLETWESYTGFCYKHQFPPTLSERVKSRLYFLASQSRWEWQKYVVMVLRVLEGLSMDGSAPFPQMTDFRKECFQSFPVTHVQRMTLSQVRLHDDLGQMTGGMTCVYLADPAALRGGLPSAGDLEGGLEAFDRRDLRADHTRRARLRGESPIC
jgi:hypothetical protein